MTKRVLLFSAAILVVALAAVAGIATQRQAGARPGQEGHFGRGGGPSHHGPNFGPNLGMIVERHATELALTDQQKTEIQTIVNTERAAADTRREQGKALMEQLKGLGVDGQFDEAKVRELANQHAQGMVEQIVSGERTKASVFAILTPEQRTKLLETLKTAGPGHEGLRHHGHGR